MNILNRKICTALAQKLTFTPRYQAYIHLQDHDKKINPKQTRLYLSYMDPKAQPADVPANAPYSAKLRRSAQSQLKKRLFEQYKQKILQGTVDEQQVVEPDQLWGDQDIPVHYYRFLSATQASTLSHSILKDVQHYHKELVKDYIESSIKTTDIAEVKQINQYAEVAAYYRYNNILDREKYYQIEKCIGNKFHLLTDKSLILLKYAFNTTPKKSTPEFNKILNDLLLESLPNLSTTDLVHLLYFNKSDLFRLHKGNLQISVLQTVTKRFKEFNLEQKIDFLFLYVESRGPTIRKHAYNRYHNEIRNRAQEIIYHLDIEGDFSTLSELSVLKLAYSLVRVKSNATDHLTLSICQYLQANLDKIQVKNLPLFFVYLNKAESNKSITNLDLLKNLKQKILTNWQSYSTLDKIRSIDVIYNQNLYDETVHQLYSAIPIQVDSSILALFCRIQMMNSSGREWEVVHKLVQLDYLPFLHFQDYKRFYNYVSATAPDWKLDPLFDKLENTEIFYDALRLDSMSRDKITYKGIRQFQEFSGQKALPKPFKIATAVKNVEFAEFSLPQYQICVDIISDVERIRGTRDLKGSYQTKIKSLECVGWKQLYVYQEDIERLAPLQFFDYIYSVCEPHFEQQLKVIASYEEYRSYQIEQLRYKKSKAFLKMREREQFQITKDFDAVENERDIRNKDVQKIKEGANLENGQMIQRIPMPGSVSASS